MKAVRIIIAGLAATLFVSIWALVVNGMLRFNANINLNRLDGEREVYTVLVEHVIERGRYCINPEVIPEQGFPADEPVFTLLYSGVGHGAAGRLQNYGMLLRVLTMILATGLLSMSGPAIVEKFHRRLLYGTLLGLFLTLAKILPQFNIDGYPFGDVLLLGLHDIVLWTLIGAIMALIIRPDRNTAEHVA